MADPYRAAPAPVSDRAEASAQNFEASAVVYEHVGNEEYARECREAAALVREMGRR